MWEGLVEFLAGFFRKVLRRVGKQVTLLKTEKVSSVFNKLFFRGSNPQLKPYGLKSQGGDFAVTKLVIFLLWSIKMWNCSTKRFERIQRRRTRQSLHGKSAYERIHLASR